MTSGEIMYAVCVLGMLGLIGRNLHAGDASLGTGSYRRTDHSVRYWTIMAFDFGLAAIFAYGWFTAPTRGH